MNNVRATEIKIVVDKNIDIGSLFPLLEFLKKNKHPDFRLHILLDVNDNVQIKNQWLYDAISILKSKLDADIGIRFSSRSVIESTALDTMVAYCNEAVIKVSGNYREYNPNMIYLASRNMRVIVELIVDEQTASILKPFKDFYSVMKIQNSYKIDYFTPVSNKKQFVQEVLNQLTLIVQGDNLLDYIKELAPGRRSYCPSFEKSFAYHLDGTITHCHIKNDIVLNNDINNQINKLKRKIDLSKCSGCIALETCGGGCYAVFETTSNSDVFCAINMGLQHIKSEFLNGRK